MGSEGFGSELWKQARQVRVTREGGIQAPVTADGTRGINLGDPPLTPFPTQTSHRGPGLFAKVLRRLRPRRG
jgi:hypothetical protein